MGTLDVPLVPRVVPGLQILVPWSVLLASGAPCCVLYANVVPCWQVLSRLAGARRQRGGKDLAHPPAQTACAADPPGLLGQRAAAPGQGTGQQGCPC